MNSSREVTDVTTISCGLSTEALEIEFGILIALICTQSEVFSLVIT